jgi:hypothetical protein
VTSSSYDPVITEAIGMVSLLKPWCRDETFLELFRMGGLRDVVVVGRTGFPVTRRRDGAQTAKPFPRFLEQLLF